MLHLFSMSQNHTLQRLETFSLFCAQLVSPFLITAPVLTLVAAVRGPWEIILVPHLFCIRGTASVLLAQHMWLLS